MMFGVTNLLRALKFRSDDSGSRPVGALAGAAVLGRRALAPVASLAYRWYGKRLLAEVRIYDLPGHVAMILDGNRRFARMSGLADPSDGYRYGARKVREVIGWCDELAIPVVTLWGISTDNLQRSPSELSKIFESIGAQLDALSQQTSDRFPLRKIQAVGRIELLDEQLRNKIQDAERRTAGYGPGVLNVAVAYGGRDEILDAVGRMLRTRGAQGASATEIAADLSSESFQPYLYAPDIPEPDLIVRTSGEMRLSGFMLWQSVYSELYFSDVPWPAFRKIDFLRAIRSFQVRRRRYGK
jgi:short-chain Z-isoprenyl diphosphate synthase